MIFSSLAFLFYFLPMVLIIYFAVSFSRKLQNTWLLVSSLLFYAWGEPGFVFFMILSIIVNWLLGVLVTSRRSKHRDARWLIAIAVIFNISVLFFYKYLGFVIDNINFAAGFSLLQFDKPHLPLGISFFTFQALSYVIDVYRGDIKAEKSPFFVGLYIAFFPALVAGPIVRYTDISEQMRNRKMNWGEFSEGCARFVIGVAKKTLLALPMGMIADRVFELSAVGHQISSVPAMLAWIGLAAYTMQIYFDFSGYSDMAIGLGKMFGFSLKENFNYPYVSRSVTEFWRRWHISLSSWFRDYVYIPLGGSRPSAAAVATKGHNYIIVRNIFVVWLLTGIWHGAEWTFIIWGMWYFVFLLFERVTKFHTRAVPPVIGYIYMIFITMLGWMFFRASSLPLALEYLGNMFALNNNGFFSDFGFLLLKENWIFFLMGILFCTPFARNLGEMMKNDKLGAWGKVFSAAYPFVLTGAYALSVVYMVKGNYAPFIYFNF